MGKTKTNTFLGSIISARYSRLVGFMAAMCLFVIFGFALVPVCDKPEDTFAAPTPSTTTLAMTTPSVSLSLALDDAAGTFAVSDPAEFSVTTNNYTGYELSIRAKVDDANNTKLVNGNYALNSVTAATADDAGFSVGDWGYKPSKLNSVDNTNFLPAPTYAGSVLNATTTANTTADNYSLALAAKADYTTIAGTYSNTFVLTAVPNPVNYIITYDKNTTDEVTNIPSTQIGTLSSNDVIIPNVTPVRSGATFIGWCNGTTTTTNGIDSCGGATFSPGDAIPTSAQTINNVTLKAMWRVVPIARAILGSNGNLNFVYDNNTYTTGSTYTDNLGSTTISAVYDVPTDSTSNNKPGWTGYSNSYNDYNYRTDITSVNFTQSFSSFKPTSTAYWFEQDRYISTITNSNNLNVSNATDMSYMFNYAGYNATSWSTGSLNSWNVSSVTNMSYMFSYAGHDATSWSIGSLNSWNVSSVTNMSYMFRNAGGNDTTWNIGDLSSWNVSNVTNMSYMFSYAGYYATTWNIGDLSSWNVSNVTNMAYMFELAGGFTATTWNIGNLSSWNVSNVTSMSGMFSYAGYNATTWNIGNLSSWNVSNVTSMSGMFRNAGYKASSFSLNLSSWNVSNVIYMPYMFSGAGYSATSWSIGNIGNWGSKTSKVTNMTNMFYKAGYSATSWSIGSLNSWNVSSVTNMSYMFRGAGYKATTSWSIGDISSWNVSSVTEMNSMFEDAGYSAKSWGIGSIGNWGSKTSNVTNMNSMFKNAGYSASYSLNLRSWNVQKVTRHLDFNTGVTTKITAPTWSR